MFKRRSRCRCVVGSFKSLLFVHHEHTELQCNTSRNRGVNYSDELNSKLPMQSNSTIMQRIK